MASTIKAYSVPFILFAVAMYYQLFVIPSAFPPSHYDVLGIQRFSSIEEVNEAYDKLAYKWNLGVEVPDADNFIKIRYAYELLTNPLWKRDYDIFGIDEQLHIIESSLKQYAGKNYSELPVPLLDATEPVDHTFNVMTLKDFQSLIPSDKPWLIQLCSYGSKRCAQFSEAWKRIVSLFNGVSNTGFVELGEVQLAAYFSDKKSTGKPYFKKGLPSLVVVPPRCVASNCLMRYEGDLSVDAITDWFATSVMLLPRIHYYSKETLASNFLAQSSPRKVKVLFFSKTGLRATPFLRQAAKSYWTYASFAFVLWREEEYSIWWTAYGVESAPAMVILKDPGSKPIVHHGSINNSRFLHILEHNKKQELSQLRSITSMELGCDPRSYSRAGYDAHIWYCAIVVGRPGPALNSMRKIMCRVQETISEHDVSDAADKNQSFARVADAFRRKRLTFAWLDGERQKDYCLFYLNTMSLDTCGPRRDLEDLARLFIVRYRRKAKDDSTDSKKDLRTTWYSSESLDSAAQFVSIYNGSNEISEIIQWLSFLIHNGDSKDLPFFLLKTPELVPDPDDSERNWAGVAQSNVYIKLKQRIGSVFNGIHYALDDPRIGPYLLLGALMSFGAIWLRRRQGNPIKSNQTNQQGSMDDQRERRRERVQSGRDIPPSITDLEPKDAYQMPLSDSESE